MTVVGAIAVLFSVLAQNAHSAKKEHYKIPKAYQANCPKGYFNAVTEPAVVRKDFNVRKLKIYRLPKNVCARRISIETKEVGDGRSFFMPTNFTKSDFIPIKRGKISPFKGVKFNKYQYEPLVGHYTSFELSWADSTNSNSYTYMNFNGKHPFLVSRKAAAAIEYKRGQYLIDKQTAFEVNSANGKPKSHYTRCPHNYSTYGLSKTCYSQKNGVKVKSGHHVELVELSFYNKKHARQRCPQGMAMAGLLGSNRGLCTSTQVLFEGLSKFGIRASKYPGQCPHGTAFYKSGTGACLPQLTAVHCDEDSIMQKTNENPSRVMIWPTYIVGENSSLVEFVHHYDSTTTRPVSAEVLKIHADKIPDDEVPFTISPVDNGLIPMIHMHTSENCSSLVDNGGYALDPITVFW